MQSTSGGVTAHDGITFAVVCDRAGSVRRVVANVQGLAPPVGRLLTGAVAPGSLGAALEFLGDVERAGAIYGRQLDVMTPEGIRALQFAGSVVEDGLLVICGGNWR